MEVAKLLDFKYKNMKLRIKKIHENAIIPKYAHDTDACFDLTACTINIVNEKEYGYIEYGTGLQMEIPYGFCGLIFPRSSISNTGLILSNAVGVVDSSYRGEIKARFKWIPETKAYSVGDRCCQMMIIPVDKVEFEEFEGDWEETERNEGGFGSSGV